MTDTANSDNIIESIDDTDDESLFQDDRLLGRYISHHPVNRIRLLAQVGIIYLIATAFLEVVFFDMDNQLASIIVPIIFSAIALGLGWYVMHLWNREVVVYEKGFNYREGSIIADFGYDEVASFRQKAERLRYFAGLFRRNVYTFIIRTHTNEVIKLTNLYTDIEKLGNNLEVGINLVLRDRVRQSLLNGESVVFSDSFSVSESGMMADGRDLSWDDFAGFGTKQGFLTISSTSDDLWYQIRLEEVDNLTLLGEILRQKVPKTTQQG